jgi:hypothetical protein
MNHLTEFEHNQQLFEESLKNSQINNNFSEDINEALELFEEFLKDPIPPPSQHQQLNQATTSVFRQQGYPQQQQQQQQFNYQSQSQPQHIYPLQQQPQHMYPQQQQQQISNTNNQFRFHHYHYYSLPNQQQQQAPVYSQLQPFQQYPQQQQHQLNQTYATNQPINSQQQIVFQPPINQPTEQTNDQIKQSKVVKRGNKLSNENKKSAKRAKLDMDQKSKAEKEEIAYKELNERMKKERLVNQAYDDELFECIQNYVTEYRKAEKLKKIKESELQATVNLQISSQNQNLNIKNDNTLNIKLE